MMLAPQTTACCNGSPAQCSSFSDVGRHWRSCIRIPIMSPTCSSLGFNQICHRHFHTSTCELQGAENFENQQPSPKVFTVSGGPRAGLHDPQTIFTSFKVNNSIKLVLLVWARTDKPKPSATHHVLGYWQRGYSLVEQKTTIILELFMHG